MTNNVVLFPLFMVCHMLIILYFSVGQR